MIRTVVIDDEQPAVEMMKHLLSETGQAIVVGEFTSATQALVDIVTLKPDVVFLDIEMPGLDGLRAAEKILTIDPDINVVFVTAYDHYAIKAFEINALDYLLKPVLPVRLEKTLARLAQQLEKRPVSTVSSGRVLCLGSFEAIGKYTDSKPIRWRTAKTEELFAYLLYNRDTIVPKGRIIDNLWPDDEPDQADNNLHTTIYKLRKTLKSVGIDIDISLTGGGYLLNTRNVFCDVVIFENFVKMGLMTTAQTINEFEDMIALYRSSYLDGKDYVWCLPERERMAKYFTAICKSTARYYLDNADFSQAVAVLWKAINSNPFEEDAHEMLMTAYAQGKDRAALIKHYRHIEDLLAEELGVQLSPSTRRLYELLLSES